LQHFYIQYVAIQNINCQLFLFGFIALRHSLP